MKKSNRERDKELEAYIEEEYKKQIEEEKENKEKPLDVFKTIFEKDPEEQEFDEYYREHYKEDYERELKEDKRVKIIAASIFVAVFIVFGVGIYIISEIFKPDLLKITKPMLENYYIENYNNGEKITDIEYLTKYNSETRKYEDTNIVLATLSDNTHLMCIDNSSIGSDISTSKVYDAYKNDIREYLSGTDIVFSNPTLSYTDYYTEYSIFYDYIKVLPDFKSFEDLLISQKISLTDVIVYTGDIDVNKIKSYLFNFTPESIIYAIKENAGEPVMLTVVTRDKIDTLPVEQSLIVQDKITNYAFNTDYCDVNNLTINKVNPSIIDPNEGEKYSNAVKVSYKKVRRQKDEPSRPVYFLLKVTDRFLSGDSLTLINTKGFTKRKIESYKNRFPQVAYISFDKNMFIIGNSEVGFANKQ